MHLNQAGWAMLLSKWNNSKIELILQCRAVLMKLSRPFKICINYTEVVKRIWSRAVLHGFIPLLVLTNIANVTRNKKAKNWCACSSYSSIPSLQIFARTTRATHANSEGSRPHLTNLRAPVSVLRRCTRWDRYLPFLCCLQPGTSCSGTPGWAGTCLLPWS